MRFSLVDHLTDNYKKSPNSNNAKLLGIVDDELNLLAYTFRMIERYRDMDRARGLTLDRAGKNVLELRKTDKDEEYRRMIKVKIKANLSKGDIDTIADVAEALLGGGFVRVGETWSSPKYSNEPAGVYIRVKSLDTSPELRGEPVYLDGSYYLNGEKLLNGGYEALYDPTRDLELIKTSLKRVVSGGVRLYWEIPEKAVTVVGINIVQEPTIKLRQVYIVPIDIKQRARCIAASRAIVNDMAAKLDGAYSLAGQLKLDGRRERVAHKVSVREVVA